MKDFLIIPIFLILSKNQNDSKIKKKTSCIYLILTNLLRHFQNSKHVETGLSGFHKMTITVMKSSFKKLKSKIISYYKYNNFNNSYFWEELMEFENTKS